MNTTAAEQIHDVVEPTEVDFVSIAPRVYLLTRMLMDLGHNPPVKPLGR